jgi:WD40 repeat protein
MPTHSSSSSLCTVTRSVGYAVLYPKAICSPAGLFLVRLQLPVLSLDISSDSKLIVTCSADKNVKIWGLDFGDCHRSLFAHDDSIMQVAFEKDTHYFWTVSKDKLLKYWDGDKV